MPVALEGVRYVYNQGLPDQVVALDGVDLEVREGEFLGVIGPTGSGKSTLVQHLNALLRPTSGRVLVDGRDVWADKSTRKWARRKVGLVFQYPEQQLFEETVYDDVAFAPRNFGLPPDKVQERVRDALRLAGLDHEAVACRSPFELSGGQKRRVAIAGVLAMKPSILVLDEPTAGLDPAGRKEILGQIYQMHAAAGMGVVVVSHSMEEVARLAGRLVVLHKGRVILEGSPAAVFTRSGLLQEIGLDVPPLVGLMEKLRRRGLGVRTDVYDVMEAKDEIVKALKGCDPSSGERS